MSFFEKECELLFACPSEQFPHGKSKDEEDRAYQKLMSIFGEEKMFLIRVKSNRYNVSLSSSLKREREIQSFRIKIEFNTHVLEWKQSMLI